MKKSFCVWFVYWCEKNLQGEQVKTICYRFYEAKSPKQGDGRAECTEAIGDDYATRQGHSL